MFAKWFEEYRKNYLETRFISQLPAFLISLFSLLSLYTNLHAGYLNQTYVKSNVEYFGVSIFFHILIAFLFGVRFVLFFFNSKKGFWLAQLLWICIIATIIFWSAYSRGGFAEISNDLFYKSGGAAPSFDGDHSYFSLASDSLQTLLSIHFFTSPIRQFFTFVISTFKR